MSEPALLFVHGRARPMPRASHHWLATAEGFRSFVAGWRDVRVLGPDLAIRGYEVLGSGERRAIPEWEVIRPAVVVHRKMIRGASRRLFTRLAAACPTAQLSYDPSWRAMSMKWACERAFRAAERDGILVPRPRTFLVRAGETSDELTVAGACGPLIFKPSAGSMCHGIRISTPSTFPRVLATLADSRWRWWVAQDLVTDPWLYRGRKLDLRAYVLVSSFHPLRVCVFRQGVVRVAAHDFDPAHPDDGLAALTGCSYRKRRHADTFNLSVTDLLRELDAAGQDIRGFWDQVDALAQAVFGALAAYVSRDRQRRFCLAGIDILPRAGANGPELLFLETNWLPQLNAWGADVDVQLQDAHRGWLRELRALCEVQ